MNRSLVLWSLLAAVASAETEVEYPDVFGSRDNVKHCDDNGVVAAWCDSRVLTDLECGILPAFDE